MIEVILKLDKLSGLDGMRRMLLKEIKAETAGALAVIFPISIDSEWCIYPS